MSDSILFFVIWNSVVAMVLAIIVWLCGQLEVLRRRPALLHSLWLLVLVTLLVPSFIPLPVLNSQAGTHVMAKTELIGQQPSHVTTISLFSSDAGNLESVDAEESSSVMVNQPDSPDGFGQTNLTEEPEGKRETSLTLGKVSTSVPAPMSTWANFLWILGLFWILGTARILAASWNRFLEIGRTVRRATGRDLRIEAIVTKAARQMNLKDVKVRVANGKFSPFIWASRKEVTIVFPRSILESSNDTQLFGIACHELAHFARRDQMFNCFGLFVSAIYWWHPAAWLAYREMRNAQEVCADEIAIIQAKMSRKGYLETLLHAISVTRDDHSSSLGLASSFGNRSSIRTRFRVVANGVVAHQNGWKSRCGIVLVFLVALCIPVSANNLGHELSQEDSSTESSSEDLSVGLTRLLRLEGIMTKGSHRGSFSPDGNYFAVGAGDRADSRIYRVSNGKVVCTFDTNSMTVADVEFTPDGKAIASCSHNGVMLSDVATGDRIRRFHGHTTKLIREVDISTDGKWLVSGSANRGDAKADATIRIWEIATGKQLHLIPLLSDDAIRQRRTCMLNSMEISPDGTRVLASVCYYGKDGPESCGMVAEFDIRSGRIERILCAFSPDKLKPFLSLDEIPGDPIELSKSRVAAYSPDGSIIATGHEAVTRSSQQWNDEENCVVRLWEAKTGKNIKVLRGHRSNVFSLDFSKNSKRLVSCSWDQYHKGKALKSSDHSVRIWDVVTGRQLGKQDLVKPGVSVRLSPEGDVLASIGAPRHHVSLVELWRLTDLQESREYDPLSPIEFARPRPNASNISVITAQIETSSKASNLESLYVKRAIEYAKSFQWVKAAADYRFAIDANRKNSMRWMRAGLIRLLSNQSMAYDILVKDMIKHFAKSERPQTLERLVMLSVLPKTQTGDEKTIGELVAKARKINANRTDNLFLQVALAMYHYRFENYRESLETVAAVKKSLTKSRYLPGIENMIQLVEVLSLHRSGDSKEAFDVFLVCDRALRKKLANPDLIRDESNWQTWLICKILHDECIELFKESGK